MGAEDTLYLLHTSGSTAKPKGALHTSAGYLLHAAVTHKWIFDIHDDSVWWCAADVGWVTGHSYIVYGPLANGTTSVSLRGRPRLPGLGSSLADRRALRRHVLLHGADADPLVRKDGREVPGSPRPLLAARTGHGRRADQPGGVGVVLEGDRRRALPRRRHVVADRDRRHPDHPAARRDDAETRLGHGCVPRDLAADRGRAGQPDRAWQRRLPDRRATLAGHVPDTVRRRRALRAYVLLEVRARGLRHGRRREAGRGRLLLADGPHRRRDQRRRPPPVHDRDRVDARRASRRRGGRGHRRLRPGPGPADRLLRAPEGGLRSVRGTRRGAPRSSSRRRSARSRGRPPSSSATTCRRRAPARSCGAC